MKRLSNVSWHIDRVLYALAMLMFVTQSSADEKLPSPADVLLQDSFEEGAKAPSQWKQGSAVPGVKYVYDRRIGSDGKRSLSLQKSVARFFPIAQWSRTVDHTGTKPALRISAKVKASQARKAILDVAFLDAGGQFIKHEWAAYIGQKESGDPPATHDWKSYQGAVEIPPGTKKIVVGLQIYGPGKVWFDELDVRYVDSIDDAKAETPDATSANDSRPTGGRPAATPPEIEVSINDGLSGRYLLIEPDPAVKPAAAGYPVLIVLPGGAGTADFHPFIRNIHQHALDSAYVVAQPLAPPYVVWPTRGSQTRPMPQTEELIKAVVDDVAGRYDINRNRILLLAWSSGGPAAYATLLDEETPITGALIAMSVFKPDQLPPLENAQGRSLYILHSPDDQVCPYRMAKSAAAQFQSAGVRTTLAHDNGGHGWQGPVFDHIRKGIGWLEAE